jgi:ABC-type sugar transport system permease subunit
MILWHAEVRRIPGPPVEFACPRCSSGPAAGSSYEQIDSAYLFFVIPFLRLHNTYVVCGNCSRRLATRMTLDDLRQCEGVDISRFVFHRVSFVAKTLSVLSLVLCLFPFLGMILAVLALAGTFKSPGVWRTIAIISLVISVVPASLVLLGIWR